MRWPRRSKGIGEVRSHMGLTEMLPSAILSGIIFGCILLASACYHWVRNKMFGLAGVVLSTVGVVLFGMSVWASVEYGAPKVAAKPVDTTVFQRMIEDGNEKTLAEVKQSNKQLAEQLQQFTQQLKANQDTVFSNIQSHVLAIRTALTERPAVTQQPGTEAGTSTAPAKRRSAKPR